jgi:hypothetical protein
MKLVWPWKGVRITRASHALVSWLRPCMVFLLKEVQQRVEDGKESSVLRPSVLEEAILNNQMSESKDWMYLIHILQLERL